MSSAVLELVLDMRPVIADDRLMFRYKGTEAVKTVGGFACCPGGLGGLSAWG